MGSKEFRILTIINALGDTGQYFMPLFEGLTHRGHRLVVVSGISQLTCSKLTRMGISFVNLDKKVLGLDSLENMVRFPFILARIMKIIHNEKIDMIHVHNPFMPLLLGCIASNVKSIPIVLTIHGGSPSFGLKLNPIRQTHAITSTSLERKETFPGRNKEVTVIPLPIDLERFSPNFHLSTKKGNTSREILLISSGRTSVADYLIESSPKLAEFFENIRIVIAGGSNVCEVENAVRRMNKKLDKEMIALTGFVDDTPKMMNRADIVIGVGIVVAEAMACGKPVIVAGPKNGPYGGSFGGIVNEQNVEDLRKNNFTGRNSAVPTDAEIIFKTVGDLLRDEEYRKHLGEFGRRYAEKEFEPDKIASRVESVYRRAKENAQYSDNFPSPVSTCWPVMSSMLYLLVNRVLVVPNFRRRAKRICKLFAKK